MEKPNKQKEEWHPQVIKWQEIYHNKEYAVGLKSSDAHTYKTIEHEAVVLYERYSGQSKIVKHDVVITGEKE